MRWLSEMDLRNLDWNSSSWRRSSIRLMIARLISSATNYRTPIILHAGQRPNLSTTSRLRGPYATAA